MQSLTSKKLMRFEVIEWPLTLSQQNGLQDAIHAPHLAERDRYILALEASDHRHIKGLAQRMATCADSVHLFADPDTGQVKEYLHRCKSRLCPLCARSRAFYVGSQVEGLVRAMKRPRHLVLTVKSRSTPLRSQLAELRNWFAKLRRTAFWKSHINTGVYTVEVTINERTGLWHPHVHCVFDGQYLPFKILRRTWHGVTNGSDIVWIEEVDNVQGMARELCKYIGKPQDAEHWTDAQIREYAMAIHGARMMQSFGKSAPKPIADADPNPPKPDNRWSISLARILWLADQDNCTAAAALPLVAELFPHLGRYIYTRIPQLEPEGTKAERMRNIMAIIDSGRAPPRHAPPPSRDPALAQAELYPLLSTLHSCEPDD